MLPFEVLEPAVHSNAKVNKLVMRLWTVVNLSVLEVLEPAVLIDADQQVLEPAILVDVGLEVLQPA